MTLIVGNTMQDGWEPDLNGQSKHITTEYQQELLQQAKETGCYGNPGRMLEALHRELRP